LNVFSGLLLETAGKPWSAESDNYVQSIRATGQQMSNVLEGLLLLSRISQSELWREPVDLSKLAGVLLADWQRAQPERQVEVTIEPDMVVEADRRLVQVLLENLLGNAWKFTAKQEVAKIAFGSELVDHSRIFFIRDNGAGFDMAYAHKLFVP